jgi:hypothetical protein
MSAAAVTASARPSSSGPQQSSYAAPLRHGHGASVISRVSHPVRALRATRPRKQMHNHGFARGS